MAKKNSTKTATKEALQASEPRVNVFKGWQGINIAESPLGWEPLEHGRHNQTDLKPNYLVVQNNVTTTDSLALETRDDTQIIAIPPKGLKFSGVSCLRETMLVCAFNDKSIQWKDITTDSKDDWTNVKINDSDGNPDSLDMTWTCIGYYQQELICLTKGGEIFTGTFVNNKPPASVESAAYIPDPQSSVKLTPMGSLQQGSDVCRVSVGYVYSNKFGTTIDCPNWTTIELDSNPVQWHSGCYLQISGNAATDYGSNLKKYNITGVDIYCRLDENQDAIFIGHVDINPSKFSGSWTYAWLGALSDTTIWTQVSTTVPTENTTKGVDASYFRVHDGRLYFWGGSDEFRLWIGGNPGNELSVARGTGGAWVDIEPGSKTAIKGTAKFKTYNGASIVTIMCSNPNTGKVKRYNLLETNVSVTSELTSKQYSTEEVANVVGSMSNYGFGVWADGLYTVNRYGLMVTTMAMESNNQLRNLSVSGVIRPVFSELMANRLSNAHMIYIDDIIYIIMGDEKKNTLDRVILCYDINAKAWYTYTYDLDEEILSMINIDSEMHWEGIGIITADHVSMIPTTGSQTENPPLLDGTDAANAFEVAIETGELTIQEPPQATTYLSQLEFRFDYFIGDLTIVVEGIDYYGRYRTIYKEVHADTMKRNYPVWMRIDELMEQYKVTIRGKARFRMTHFMSKTYIQSKKINQVYGLTDHSYYMNRDGGTTDIHHYLNSYNNLRRAIVT